MYKAINKFDRKIYTLDEWLLNEFDSTRAICPICENEMYIRAASTPQTTAHFCHYKNLNCPTTTGNAQRYEGLIDSNIDIDKIDRIKRGVAYNLLQIFQRCNELCNEDLSGEEFKSMVLEANNKKIWRYVGIELQYIPYIFLSLCNKLKSEYFFILSSNVKKYNDLWNSKNNKKYLFKIYRKNKSQFENYEIDEEYLFKYPKVNESIELNIPEIISLLKINFDEEEQVIKFLSEEIAECRSNP